MFYDQDEWLLEYLRKGSKFLEISEEEGRDDEFSETCSNKDVKRDSRDSTECSDSIQKSDTFSIVTTDIAQKILDDRAM